MNFTEFNNVCIKYILHKSADACEWLICPVSGGRESEHAPPWGESSPDDYRYANQIYTDPREREKEQHDMNKR